jgi:hypothetical protein
MLYIGKGLPGAGFEEILRAKKMCKFSEGKWFKQKNGLT